MPATELRPLSLGELLDQAFVLYRRNFARFAGIMAIPSFLLIPQEFLNLRENGARYLWSRSGPNTHHNFHFLAYIATSWLLYAFAQAAITCASADAYLGQPSGTGIGAAYRTLVGRLGRIVALTFAVGWRVWGATLLAVLLPAIGVGILLAAGGFSAHSTPFAASVATILVFFFVVLFWVTQRYAISLPLLLLEDLPHSEAVRRSVELTAGRRGPLFLAYLLCFVVSLAMVYLMQAPIYAVSALFQFHAPVPNWLVLAMAVARALGHTVAYPILAIVPMLFYFDIRVRREGFDLQHMMSSLPPNPADSAAPAST